MIPLKQSWTSSVVKQEKWKSVHMDVMAIILTTSTRWGERRGRHLLLLNSFYFTLSHFFKKNISSKGTVLGVFSGSSLGKQRALVKWKTFSKQQPSKAPGMHVRGTSWFPTTAQFRTKNRGWGVRAEGSHSWNKTQSTQPIWGQVGLSLHSSM